MTQSPPKKTSLLQEIGSVLASFFGVQSSKNRERDFTRGNARRFIILGVVMTVIFVLSVLTVVRLVLRSAGM
ncbi:MAG: DUF2970 domain-containing protein [Panacagrimonas sp.]